MPRRGSDRLAGPAGSMEATVVRRRALSVKTEKWIPENIGEGAKVVLDKLAKAEEDEAPMSPTARLFREPQLDCYIVAMMGVEKKFDFDLMRAGLEATLVHHPRFSSISVFDESGGKNPRWVRTTVDLDKHIVIPDPDALRTGDSSSSPDQLLENYVASFCRTPLDPSRPLWELHLLNLCTSDAEAVGIFRIHHSLGDGISLVSLLLACTRKTSDPSTLPTLPKFQQPMAQSGNSGVWAFLQWAWAGLLLMWHTMIDLLVFVATAMFLRDTRTPLMAGEGVKRHRRRFLHRTIDLDDVKAIKNAMGCTINDVLVGLTSAGISRYLSRIYGEKSLPNSIRLRTTLLFNIRPMPGVHAVAEMMERGSRTKWGNHLGYVVLRFPIMRCQDPLEYVRKGMAIVDRKKNSLEAIFTYISATLVAKTLGVKAAAFLHHRVLSHTTLTFSNIIGPVEQIQFCGHPIVYIAPTVYGAPHALTLHFGSYMNKMMVSMTVDESVIPDPNQLLDVFTESLDLIKDAALTSS